MTIKHIFIAAICATLTSPALFADDFDLTSQRVEVQEYNPVPGKKLNHNGLPLNPTPQSLTRHDGSVSFANGFRITDKQNKFADATNFLTANKKGLPLTIDFGGKALKGKNIKPTEGAYLLEITPKGVSITGFDEIGAFYGLQTLRQIVQSEAAATSQLPLLTINDFPTLKYRGMVEGFYGTPWSHEKRLNQLDFYGRQKLNNYIYGPKDDPYHSSPYWRQPYPEKEAQQIRELVERANKNRVKFVWAIHPGKDIRWTKEDYDSLVNKFEHMYELGVRAFALFFDDISGIGENPEKQVELLNDLTRDFVLKKGDVANIIICPTDYSEAWAKPGPNGPLAVYGRSLNPNAEVFWTGAVVCSDLTPQTLEFIDSRIKRPALYWWNYPVTDYCKHILLQGPVYGLDTTLTTEQVIGIESNPMEHAEASKLALYGVADYAWNISAYNPIDNWERGLKYLMPEAAEAYRTFAIHSTDTETGYRRDESWETTIFPYDNYSPEQFRDLRNEFIRVKEAPAQIRKGCTNPGLLQEIEPWLVQFEKVGDRGLGTLDLIKKFEAGNDSVFWEAYTANLMTDADKKDYEAHKIGTMKLHPFYERAMEGMLIEFFKNLTGTIPALYHGVGSYRNLSTMQPRLMLDNDTTTFYTSAYSQADGDWIGVDLGMVRPVEKVIVHQGRNSVDDGDYFEHVILEASADGRNWTALSDSLQKTYIITYNGEAVPARYVRIKRLSSPKNSWAAVRSFRVNPVSAETVGLNIEALNPDAALLAFDANPATSATLDGTIAFDRAKEASNIIILADSHSAPLTLEQYDAKGKLISTSSVAGAYASVNILPAAARLRLTGNAKIFELIQK